MADSKDTAEEPVDLSEEQQDWRFLSSSGSLPKRGEKDFEPNGTALQQDVLRDSRNAMYAALNGERGHAGKLHVTAVWHSDVRKAAVDFAKGPHFNTLGKSDSTGTAWLHPEELIYLVERGSLECFFPQGAPMSLQAAYAAAISNHGDLERLQVYTYLKKLGFIVMRAPSYENDYPTLDNSPYKVVKPIKSMTFNLYHCASAANSLVSSFLRSSTFVGASPLLLKPRYFNYPRIYDDLDIIPFHKPPHSNILDEPLDAHEPEYPYRIAFNIWKPTAGKFKKSNPPPPDFRVAVVSTRDTRAPTLAQSLALLNTTPVTETEYMAPSTSKKKKALEAAAAAKASGKPIMPQKRNQTWVLKDGWRNVVLAVIDAGVISFTKIADTGFGEEHVYMLPSMKGSQNKPKGKGSGAK